MADQFCVYNGTDGTSILSGNTDPLVVDGNDNDLYLNLTSYELFRKEVGAWVSKGIIKGADGANGTNGTNGIDGANGANGANGADGNDVIIQYSPDGISGWDTILNDGVDFYIRFSTDGGVSYSNSTKFVGDDGLNGADGATGATGATGDTGATGATGPQGAAGATGPAGTDGADGDLYKTTSTTSVNLSTTSIGDTVVLTVAASNLAYTAGQALIFASAAAPTTIQFVGKVSSYSGVTLTVVVISKVSTSTAADWDINLAGVIGTSSTTDYIVTATAGTGTVGSRVYTAPVGWNVGSSDTIAITGLGSNSTDLTIQHDLGRSVFDVLVYSNLSGKNSKLIGAVSYSGLDEDTATTAIELLAFATILEPLTIKIRFSE